MAEKCQFQNTRKLDASTPLYYPDGTTYYYNNSNSTQVLNGAQSRGFSWGDPEDKKTASSKQNIGIKSIEMMGFWDTTYQDSS